MKAKIFATAGAVVILLGVAGLAHPNIPMPAKTEELQIRGQKVVIQTQRIVTFPRPLSGLVILGGVGIVLLLFSKP